MVRKRRGGRVTSGGLAILTPSWKDCLPPFVVCLPVPAPFHPASPPHISAALACQESRPFDTLRRATLCSPRDCRATLVQELKGSRSVISAQKPVLGFKIQG